MSASSSAAAAAAARSAFLRGLYRRPALLLVVTTLIWGSNAVAARLAVGHVSPMMLTTARWSIACIALWLVARQQVAQHWPALRGRWTYLALMGISGFTAFNALFYAAAHHTTAVNLSLIQGMIPVLVLLGGVMFFGLRVTALQMAGVVITLAGGERPAPGRTGPGRSGVPQRQTARTAHRHHTTATAFKRSRAHRNGGRLKQADPQVLTIPLRVRRVRSSRPAPQ